MATPNPRSVSVSTCVDCPCLRASHSGRCCGLNPSLTFDKVNTTVGVHPHCPLAYGAVSIELNADRLTKEEMHRYAKGVFEPCVGIITAKGHDLDGNPVTETYEGPVSPMPFSSISEITIEGPKIVSCRFMGCMEPCAPGNFFCTRHTPFGPPNT